MKKVRLVLIPIVMLLSLIGMTNVKAEEIKKKGVENTYMLDYERGVAYNVNRKIVRNEAILGEDYEVLPNSVYANTVKRVVGMKKIEANKLQRINCIFVCSPDGKIESVRFKFPKGNIFLSVEEIEKLEKALLAEQFPVKVYNKAIKNMVFGQCCFLNKFFEE